MIEEIVRLLEDEQWHTFTEIKEAFSLSEGKLQKIVKFLKEFELIDVDEEGKRAKLDGSLLGLLI